MNTTSTAPALNAALTQVEQALARVGECLVAGQAAELQQACQALQLNVMACSRLDRAWLSGARSDVKLQGRLNAVRVGLAQVRENMARRAAAVQRSLQVLLPSSGGATYGRSASAYGRNSKSDASFTSFSA